MSQRFKRDDGSEIEVEYEVEGYGEPYSDCPGSICDGGGSSPLINITEAYSVATGDKVELTDAERERMEQWLVENIDLSPPQEPDNY